MAQGELGLENVKSVLDNHHQLGDLPVGTLPQALVQIGCCPENAEPLRKMG
jgi:hypothetical protein